MYSVVQSATTNSPMDRALQFIAVNFSECMSIDDIAGAAGISKFSLCRLFQKHFGISPIRFLWRFRATLAAEFISRSPSLSLSSVALVCGFTSSAHFSRFFKQTFQKNPSTFQSESRASVKFDSELVNGGFQISDENDSTNVNRALMKTVVNVQKSLLLEQTV